MADEKEADRGNLSNRQVAGTPSPASGAGSPAAEGTKKGTPEITSSQDGKGLHGRVATFLAGSEGREARAIILLVVVVILCWLMLGMLGKRQIIDDLSQIAYARGVITFILAVGTIGIALLVTVGGLLASNESVTEQRFNRGKEILAILVGVLGTIVGFYYGSEADKVGGGKVSIAPPLLSSQSPFVGDTVEMTFYVGGGTPPYTYEISFEDAPVNASWKRRVGHTNDLGWASEKLSLTDAVAGSRLVYTIRAVDTKGAAESYTSDKKCCIDVVEKQKEKATEETEAKLDGKV